jgi:hypothetical protein
VILVQPLVSNYSIVVDTLFVHFLINNRRVSFLSVYVLYIDSALVGLEIVNYIHVGAIDVLESSSVRVHSDTHCAEHTCDLNSVSGSDLVNKVFVCAQMDSLWGLALRYAFRCLLHFHVLLV